MESKATKTAKSKKAASSIVKNNTDKIEELVDSFYCNSALRKMLTNSIVCGHLCHAYLFYGQANTLSIAKLFAMAMQCKGEVDEKPCGICKSCKKALMGNHPDIKICEGTGANGAFLIDPIREIRQDVYIRPNESKYKIYIFKDAQKMNIAAANAMLKVFEEPPSHAVFILTADSKTNVIDTIVSRCVSFEVFAPSEYFNPSDCSKVTSDVALAFCKRDEYSLLSALHKANSSKDDMKNVILELTLVFRTACLIKFSSIETTNEVALFLAQKSTLSSLQKAIDKLSATKAAIDGNVNMGLFESNLTIELLSCL